ncbi:alpha/beta hydrolase [Nocardia sp. NPDC051990]|uniref:alpha/beta fold hydrolase n=1 Tax=Nocardia sp. NPDC051990 TaxID=3155285 RepID=UPI00342294D1
MTDVPLRAYASGGEMAAVTRCPSARRWSMSSGGSWTRNDDRLRHRHRRLAWIVERFKDWTDSTDTPEDAVDRDAMLTNVMIYWLNATAGSSARYYYEGAATWGAPEPETDVPVAVAVMPHDLGIPVRRVAERNRNIVRWTEFDCGGHFAAMEEPDLIVADLRATFREYRE